MKKQTETFVRLRGVLPGRGRQQMGGAIMVGLDILFATLRQHIFDISSNALQERNVSLKNENFFLSFIKCYFKCIEFDEAH